MPRTASRLNAIRRLLLAVGAVALSALSCGREPTAPGGGAGAVRSQAIAFAPEFPASLQAFQTSGGSGVVFTKVHIVLLNQDGTVAYDGTVDFPDGVDELPVTLSVPLAAGAPASGVPLTLTLDYQNAAGVTVFHGGPVTVTAVPATPGGGPPPPSPVTIPITYTGPGANAMSVEISPSTLTVNTGAPFTFTAQAFDAGHNVVPNTPIVFNTQNGAFATINAATGAGTAGGLRGSVGIVAQLLTGPTSTATLTIVSPAAAIAASAGTGQTGKAGATLATPVVTLVTAADGLPAPGVAVTFAAQNGGTVGAASVTTDASGLAQTTWKLGPTAGPQTLTASAAGLSGSPVTFTATATSATPVRLTYATQPPTTAAAGTSLAPAVQVRAEDVTGALASGFTDAVTVALGTGAPTGAVLSGTTTVNAVAGIATFGDLKVNVAGSYTLDANAASLSGVTSSAFTIVAGNANKLAFVNYPVIGAVAGTTFDPITVVVRDAIGNVVTSFTGAVTLGTVTASAASRSTGDSVSANGVAPVPAQGANALTGTTTVNAVAGVATFSGIRQTTAGGFSLTATSPGLVDVTGPAFTITPGPASNLGLVSGGAQSAAGAATLASPVVVAVTDAFGNGVSGVTVNFAPTAPSGSASPTSAVTGAGGLAQTAWTLGGAAGPMTLNVTSPGLLPNPLVVSATATTTTVAGPATQLVFSTQPSSVATATNIAPAIVVVAKDASNLVATGFTGNVTLAIGTNPAAGTLSGTLTVAAVAGVATFASVQINNAGVGYTLTAASIGLTGATSNAFNVGIAGIASTLVTPHATTITAIGATFGLAAQAKDGANNPVAGSFAWVSRTPAVATVNAGGTVTAVTNGTTWVVATEAGGTKDSALVTVLQTLATISVTPNPRNIYLGASYQFAASAVDGLGVPLTAQPSFTWSTASGAVASVNGSGLATGTGLGSTQVQATSGAVTGTALLNVLTPITRIVVSRDSAGFAKTASDTFTLGALGKTRSYIATARDTLDNPLPGVTFTWASSNGAVAGLDSINTATVRATAGANGVTSISASAQGKVGAASLTVQQVLTSIDLSPTTATIAPTGSVALVARGRDANNFFIPGGAFTFTSAQPAIATVGAATGVVTGVANGSASITAASGAITSNAALITVGGAVPATISFGRDTLTVGRSGSVSVPVYLSKPFGNAVTINLAVRDTFAFFSAASISIPAGQTSGNATLNGHNAGTTQVYATDGGGGGGYAGDTAVLAVQATVKLTTTSYSLNVTDQLSTQVLLSDPAPAGGTYVTFNYGTPSKVNVSPDPAFIPAGQLAANVVILGTGTNTGGTTVTPAATGVNGTASTVYTYAATLTGTTSIRLGVGQYEPNDYAQASTYFNAPLAVTLTSSDSTKVRVPSGMSIGSGSYYQYYTTTALATGTATVTASAPGWTPLTNTVTVTTPKVGVCCSTTYNTTSPQFGVTVYAEDSTSTQHYRSNALVVSLSSTDPTVLQVLTPTVTIPAGQSYTSSGLVIPGGSGGTARIIATASGHNPDSTGVYTVVGPKLSFGWTSSRIGVGQQDQSGSVYVQVPNNVTGTPLVITLANTDSTILGAPPTVTIPVGTYYTYFTVRGKATGTITMYATAPGYSPDTATYVVTSALLNLSPGGTLNNFAPGSGVTVYASDSVRSSHTVTAPVIVTYTSTNPAVFTVTGADTIQAGLYYANHALVTPTGVGTAKIIATAAGYGADSTSYTVQTPKLSFSWFSSRLGRRQYDQNYYVQVPNNRTSPLSVTVTRSQPTVDSLSQTAITIPNGTYYTYFNVAGLNTGADTLIASAAGYLPDTAYVIVTTPKLVVSGLPSNVTTTNPPSTVTVYATDSVGTQHLVLDTVIVKATSSNSAVVQPTAAGFRINPATYYSQPQVAYTGPGSASVTYADSLGSGYLPATTNTVTVTGPSLTISNGAAVLGMRQNGGPNSAYVQVPNNITGTPLVVTLVSSDPTVAQVPSTVTIPVGTYYAYFQITAQDVVGTIQVQATATGYGGATTNVQVTQPKFVMSTTASVNTTSPRQTITIYATDANGTQHYTNEDVSVSLASSSGVVGTTDSATVTIITGHTYTQAAKFIPGAAGTTQLSATDARVAAYKYSPATFNVAVNIPTLTLSFSNVVLGIGQYDNQTVYTPDYQASALTVNLAHFNGSTTTPSTVTIGSATYYATMKVIGALAGIDTITYSASGHNPVKGAITVAAGRLDPISSWPGSLNQGDSVLVTIYARDVNTNVHYANAATALTLTPSGKIQFVSGGVGSVPITTATIPADAQYVQVWVKALATGSGTGSAQISSTNYTTYTTPTVNVP